jgi:hypothetical protein
MHHVAMFNGTNEAVTLIMIVMIMGMYMCELQMKRHEQIETLIIHDHDEKSLIKSKKLLLFNVVFDRPFASKPPYPPGSSADLVYHLMMWTWYYFSLSQY